MVSRRRTIGAIAGGVAALAIGVSPAVAAPTPGPTTGVAGAATLGGGTTLIGSVPAGQAISFSINLGLKDQAGAERYGVAAATPGTPEFGHFLSEAQFEARFGAQKADVAAVRGWLRANGVTTDEVIGDQVLVAHGTSGHVASAFGTRFARISTNGKISTAAVTPLTVPATFAHVVDGVIGLSPGLEKQTLHTAPRTVKKFPLSPAAALAASTRTPTVRAAAALPNDPTCPQFFGQTPSEGPRPPFTASATSVVECSVFYDPSSGAPFLMPGANYQKTRTLASIDSRYPGNGATVGLVLWNNDPQGATLANLAAAANRAPALKAGQLTQVINTNTFTNCQATAPSDRVEIDLDIQTVRAAAPAANIRFYGSTSCVIPEISIARALGEAAPPSVISNSWGFANTDYNANDPQSKSLHASMVKAATRGVTVLFSSGDTGDGTTAKRVFGIGSPRVPGYPATDPYVTAVGGVGFGTNAVGRVAFKQAWIPAYYSSNGTSAWAPVSPASFGPNSIGTGGGVSRSFPEPAWQKSAGVAVNGRAIPDIANIADSFFLPFVIAYNDGGNLALAGVGGTSAASPLTAGQVADAAVVQRNRYFGLITPSLYRQRATTIVSDVVRNQTAVTTRLSDGSLLLVGGERGSETLVTKTGWDNATGLGLPSTGFLGRIGR